MTERSYRVGVIPGDGTGPEVVREGLKVLDAVRDGFATRSSNSSARSTRSSWGRSATRG